MKKEIKHEIKTYEVKRTELYCDICNARIKHHEKYWNVFCSCNDYNVCSDKCANQLWMSHVNGAKSFFDFNFSCEPMFWNEFTGKGEWGPE